MQRLGCLTPFGIGAGLLALAGVILAAVLSGGSMFSPGALNAQNRPGLTLGGISTHADLGGNCGACHAPPLDTDGMSARCLACHTSIQSERTNPSALHGVIPADQSCRACHSEHGGAAAPLTNAVLPAFDHAALGFALTAHKTTAAGQPFGCADCHPALTQTPHPSGAYRFAPDLCQTCHNDYQRERMTRHIADVGTNCLACHDGVDRYSDFDHAALKLPLDGKHAEASCASCHRAAHDPDGFSGLDATCISCHRADDAHQGAFGSDCAACHTAAGWKPATFDHSKTAFPLTGAHQSTTCASCHANHIYQGTSKDCVSCHAEPQAHLGQFGTDCVACHSTTAWKPATFDHSKTAFPLTGAHQSATCASCHANHIYQGTPKDCVSCHAEPQAHLGQFGTDCASCHSTATWQGARFDHTFPLNHGGGGTIACATCHTIANNYTSYTCYGCHEHTEAKVIAEHAEERINNLNDCVRCHATGRKEDD